MKDIGHLRKGSLRYEGKAKKVFSTFSDTFNEENSPYFSIEFKDTLTALNGKKKETLVGKGRICAQISKLLFCELEQQGIATHWVSVYGDDEKSWVVKKLSMLPLEIVVRNYAAGSIVSRLGIERGTRLSPPLCEFYYKNDSLNDPLLNSDHIQYLNILNREEITIIKNISLHINSLLKNIFLKINFQLIDIKFEFGRIRETAHVLPSLSTSSLNASFIVGDEISPDTMRLWDMTSGESYDKDRFRQDKGQVLERYTIVYEKLKTIC